MKIGTRSLLFGYHQFILHPLFVALAWWRLYGFPRDFRLWAAFFVHDIGYFGKPNMDGPEGELHPFVGATLMWKWFGPEWFTFTLHHSRFLSKKYGQQPSRLCVADKWAIVITPTWLQLLLMNLTGEIHEYQTGRDGRTEATGKTQREWVLAMKQVCRDWVNDNRKHL